LITDIYIICIHKFIYFSKKKKKKKKKKKDILKINNLWSLKNLTKLQLDNNIIEKIENINFLVNLTWLGNFFFFY